MQKKSSGVIILCYHRFKKRAGKKAEKDRPYVLSPAVFKKQMKIIKQEGYTVISMKKLAGFMEGKASLPVNPLVITIDDGFACTFTKAYPVLKEFSYPAVSYIYEDFIDEEKYYLTKSRIREMGRGEMEFGSHSKSHPRLSGKKGREFLEREIITSRKNLEKITGTEIETFSYPYGAYSKRLFPLLKKAGYRAAVTVENGVNTKKTNKYELKRFTIYSGWSLTRFRNLLKKYRRELSGR